MTLTAKNTRQTFLYIKDFRWLSPIESEMLQNHPRKGKVYQATFNPDTKNYAISILPNVEIFLDNLYCANEESRFTYDIIEISRENFLDLNLEETDLDQIIEWMKPQTGLTRLATEMKDQEMHEYSEQMAAAVELLAALREVDSTKFEILLQLVDTLIQTSLEEPSDPAIHLKYNPTTATGINISRVLRNLDTYACENVRINRNIEDIEDSIVALIGELEMRNLNDNE